MKTSSRSASPARRLACSLALASALVFSATQHAAASTVTIDFDGVSLNSSAGLDPTAYLASYGVTLSGVSPSNPEIYTDLYFYSPGTGGVVDASSGNNFLLQQSAVNGGSFTLNFATALTNVEFTRIRNITFNSTGAWTATAYAGATVVGSASEPFGLDSFSAATYSFSGAGITSLSFSGNGFNFAGISSAMIDDLKLTSADSVPDTASTVALMGISLAGLVALRRRFVR